MMALSSGTIRRYSVFFLRFLFYFFYFFIYLFFIFLNFWHVQVFLSEMSLACRLERPFVFIFYHNCFLVISILLILAFLVLFLVAIMRLPLRFSMESLSRCIDVSTLYRMLAMPAPPPFLDSHSRSTLSLKCNALSIVMNFLVLWFICLSPSQVHFKNGSEYLTKGQPRYLTLL